MRAVSVALLGIVAAGATGCPLFTDSINELPQVSITGPRAVYLEQPADFEARVPNEVGTLRYDWGQAPRCPATLADAFEARRTGALAGGGAKIRVSTSQRPDQGNPDYCLFVVVTDSLGAQELGTLPVDVLERKLVVKLTSAPLVSSTRAKFSAVFEDEPAATARALIGWGLKLSCPEADAQARSGLLETIPLGQSTHEPIIPRQAFCVVAAAQDQFGAVYVGQLMLSEIQNGGPPVGIRVVSPAGVPPFGIFSDIRMAVAERGELAPDDAITFAWRLTRPDGSTSVPPPCPEVKPVGAEICFPVIAGGTYKVEVTATEGTQTAMGMPLSLVVEDRPPCIRRTAPDFTTAPTVLELDDREGVFQVVSVDDDGDPYPPPLRESQRGFVWSVRLKGEPRFGIKPNATFSQFVIAPREYRLGDEVEVRVEYRDRLDLTDLGARSFSHCKDEDPLCETLVGSGCYQRVTWKVLYL